jgi:hypothetical protein
MTGALYQRANYTHALSLGRTDRTVLGIFNGAPRASAHLNGSFGV